VAAVVAGRGCCCGSRRLGRGGCCGSRLMLRGRGGCCGSRRLFLVAAVISGRGGCCGSRRLLRIVAHRGSRSLLRVAAVVAGRGSWSWVAAVVVVGSRLRLRVAAVVAGRCCCCGLRRLLRRLVPGFEALGVDGVRVAGRKLGSVMDRNSAE
jgi:hypothetical protein